MQPTIVQSGKPCSDLIVYAHMNAAFVAERAKRLTDDAFVVELRGTGTSAYHGMVEPPGWSGYVAALAQRIGHSFKRTCLVTWSAGSQAAMEAATSADGPDVLVMMDGLYGPKPQGSKPGDGRVTWNGGLTAIAHLAARAASGEVTPRGVPRTVVIFHSAIATEYASSSECAALVRQYVEDRLDAVMEPAERVSSELLDGRRFSNAVELGNFLLVSFPGRDAAEHVAEAHLWDEALHLVAPWFTEPTVCAALPPASPPELSPTTPTMPAGTRMLRVTTPLQEGPDVLAWQAFLAAQGAPTVSPGPFTPETGKATQFWQSAYGLKADGIVGPITMDAAMKAGFRPVAALGAGFGPPIRPSGGAGGGLTTGNPFGPGAVTAAPSPHPSSLAATVLARAHRDLGVTEDLGHNDGARIREMGARWGFKPGDNWCAIATSSWLVDGAADAGVPPPVAGSAGAQAVMAQFKAARRWVSFEEALANPDLVKPGMVPVWDRSVPGDPATSWWGHIGVVSRRVGTAFDAIEGNSGEGGRSVAEMHHDLATEKRLFGFGRVD